MTDVRQKLTGNIVKTSFVKNPREQLQANDGVDENDKDDQEGDAEQWNHGQTTCKRENISNITNIIYN